MESCSKSQTESSKASQEQLEHFTINFQDIQINKEKNEEMSYKCESTQKQLHFDKY